MVHLVSGGGRDNLQIRRETERRITSLTTDAVCTAYAKSAVCQPVYGARQFINRLIMIRAKFLVAQ